jgi:hypothetical protein
MQAIPCVHVFALSVYLFFKLYHTRMATGIPVILEAPLLSEVDNWEGAMVSSTSRLGLPIDEFTYPAEEVCLHGRTEPTLH